MGGDMVRFIVAALALTLSMGAWAVDGYKDLKFNMSRADVIKSKLCSFKVDETDSWQCNNLKFGNKNTIAFAYFIGDRLKRVAILIDVDSIMGVATGLMEKYGPVSSMSEQEEWNAVDTTNGAEAYMRFDNDSIIIKVTKHETFGQVAMLIYTTPDYQALVRERQGAAVADDL